MTQGNFNTMIAVDQTPEEIFNAIINVRGWWSEQIEGNTAKPGDEFIYRYKDVHYCKVKLTEVIPGKKVTWLILDNYFNFTKDKSEWKNTTVTFDITEQDGKTQLHFTHQGLTPECECYDACRKGWTNYINSSLRSLITTGKGQPNPKEGGFNDELIKKLNLKAQS